MHVSRRSAIAIVSAVLASSPLRAKPRPFLTISGRTRSGVEERWSRADLDALGSDALETATPWHEGVRRFEGVRLAKLLARAGADGIAAANLHAINDYTAAVPIRDVERYDPVLALRRDGLEMPVSDKGPLWLVWPFDRHPELYGPVFQARSFWQIDAMDLR